MGKTQRDKQATPTPSESLSYLLSISQSDLFLLLSSLLAYPFGFLPLKAGYVERRLGLRNRLASRFLNQVDAKDSCILWIKMKGRQPLDDHWNLSR